MHTWKLHKQAGVRLDGNLDPSTKVGESGHGDNPRSFCVSGRGGGQQEGRVWGQLEASCAREKTDCSFLQFQLLL